MNEESTRDWKKEYYEKFTMPPNPKIDVVMITAAELAELRAIKAAAREFVGNVNRDPGSLEWRFVNQITGYSELETALNETEPK